MLIAGTAIQGTAPAVSFRYRRLKHSFDDGALMAVAVSPLAPKSVPAMPPIAGAKLATAAAGIKYANRTDVLLALLAPGTTVAGAFTKSKCPSAPVEWVTAILKHAKL